MCLEVLALASVIAAATTTSEIAPVQPVPAVEAIAPQPPEPAPRQVDGEAEVSVRDAGSLPSRAVHRA